MWTLGVRMGVLCACCPVWVCWVRVWGEERHVCVRIAQGVRVWLGLLGSRLRCVHVQRDLTVT